MTHNLNRREFLKQSAAGFGAFVVASGLQACGESSPALGATPVDFAHGVASGDPLVDRVIIWTRVTPLEVADRVTIGYEVATDVEFSNLILRGEATTDSSVDYTLKVDATTLSPNTTYYYRFGSGTNYSPTGKTRTLPTGDLSQVKLGVVSCSNYPAGHFHVYGEVAARDDLDAVLHLGDYIYEYSATGYATEDALAMGRVPSPTHEILILEDYRQRYQQYRGDLNLQQAHQNHAFICVWDDHEVANDAWKNSAQNHDASEGDFEERKAAALQAYFEWLPVRPPLEEDHNIIYRSFDFGSLLSLHMLDTRHIARSVNLELETYFGEESVFDQNRYQAATRNTGRTLLGEDQFTWLKDKLTSSNAIWQVLGQQVLMGRMELPGSIASQRVALLDYPDLYRLNDIATREESGGNLSNGDQAFLDENRHRLTQEVRNLMSLPSLPYNLDAWDGFPVERSELLEFTANANKNLVVLAGDTHNAWASNLKTEEGTQVGVEFATASVTSPGLEDYLNLNSAEAITQGELGAVGFIQNLYYANMSNRGYMVVTFTPTEAHSEWTFVDTVKEGAYSLLESRTAVWKVLAGAENRKLVYVQS